MRRIAEPREVADLAEEAGYTLPCTQADPETMFPEDEDDPIAVEEAKQVCRSCMFRSECAAGATVRREDFGIWGGLTTKERRAALRRHYRTLAQPEMLEVAV